MARVVTLHSILFVSCVLFTLSWQTVKAPPPPTPAILHTSLGDVRGLRKLAGTGPRTVEVYYGIPFAKPPVGNLRFCRSLPAEPWDTTLDGTQMPNACWQAIDTAFNQFPGVDMWNPNTPRSEDCLYLNVWRPSGTNRSSNKTIMVWIFGGGFFSGSATLDIYDATELAARDDVIVVTIGYRTGPMGFLYLGNDVPGNAGLFDQVMALQWVKNNAHNLGGSPEGITIFGESAGGASVGFHLLSPLTRGLFKNAIMESTTPLAEWAVMDKSKAWNRTMQLAKLMSCPTADQSAPNSSIADVIRCLEEADPATMADKQWELSDLAWFDVTFGPIVDGVFLPDTPRAMLSRGDIKITDVILGVNKNEGIYFDLYGFPDIFNLSRHGEMTNAEFQQIMLTEADNNPRFKDRLIKLYKKDGAKSHFDIVDGASGDYLFKCSVVDFARDYTRLGGRAYMYSFEENLSSNPWPDWMGVPHGYEIEAIFGRPLAPGAINTVAEKNMTRNMMNLWTEFAKTGSPNGEQNTLRRFESQWPLYTLRNAEYVVIDKHGLRTKDHLQTRECKVWARGL